jgi:hypothetical protein
MQEDFEGRKWVMESRNRNSEPGMGKERRVLELAIGKHRPINF